MAVSAVIARGMSGSAHESMASDRSPVRQLMCGDSASHSPPTRRSEVSPVRAVHSRVGKQKSPTYPSLQRVETGGRNFWGGWGQALGPAREGSGQRWLPAGAPAHSSSSARRRGRLTGAGPVPRCRWPVQRSSVRLLTCQAAAASGSNAVRKREQRGNGRGAVSLARTASRALPRRCARHPHALPAGERHASQRLCPHRAPRSRPWKSCPGGPGW